MWGKAWVMGAGWGVRYPFGDKGGWKCLVVRKLLRQALNRGVGGDTRREGVGVFYGAVNF